eukprot:TRINITY_DN9085_c0_g1_i4.p1 TRINITY_DN9085_c0_g1~~TRINITY_DN9085_c0_g1_i4.p1  ORF type:complete len:297 (+),score=64.56 TRINITY_DN9085_c0_g1_i4:887-1777(+)
MGAAHASSLEESPAAVPRVKAAEAVCGLRTAPFGVSSVDVPLEVLEPLQRVFEKLRRGGSGGALGALLPSCLAGPDEMREGPYSFSVTEASTTSSMTWLWPKDETTFDLFRPIFEAALARGLLPGPAAAGPLQLWTATIIVRRSARLEESATEFHEDYWHRDVPPGFAYSLLTPLLDFPAGAGGLECFPWTRPYDPESVAEKHNRIEYRLGKIVAVDGKCLHRTEPYDLGYDSDGVRAIVSLDVHAAAPAVPAAACRKSVRAQYDNGNTYILPNPWDDNASEHSSSCSEDGTEGGD